MAVTDAHQHFWDPATAHYPWMSDAVAVLARRFGPDDLRPHLEATGVERTVFVQARSDTAETIEMMELATKTDFLSGVVGWVDLTNPGVGDVLDSLFERRDASYLVGIRHQVEDEPDPEWLYRKDVRRGLEAVQKHDLVYDLLIRPPHLKAAIDTVRAFPDARFVVDHIAKPHIKSREFEPWESLLRELSVASNTWCKISGMHVEADHSTWRSEDFVPYVARVIEMFGTERVLFGSDWPVCLLAGASYEDAFSSTLDALPPLTPEERDAFLGGNATTLYRLTGRGD